MHFISEHNILIFLVQLFILLGLARGLGEVFRKWKQPPMNAEILVGVLLGPTVFGRLFPAYYSIIFPGDIIQVNMLETVAWVGALFFLLEIGLEIDFSYAWRQRGETLKIAIMGILIPMAFAFFPCFYLPDHYLVDPSQRFIFAIYMATVIAITAMPITGRILHDLNMSKSDLGFLIMSALSVNDIIGWAIFTLVLGFITHGSWDVINVMTTLALIIGFIALCLSYGRKFADFVIERFHKRRMPEPASSLTFICLLGFFCGAVTQGIGLHAMIGFFVAGVMVGESRVLSQNTRQVISQMVYAIFVPFFFIIIGLKFDFIRNFDIFLVLLVTTLSIAGKYFGAWIGVCMTKLPKEDRAPIAIAHTPGGTMQIVVGLLALQYNLITEQVFVAIVYGALFSSVLVGPWQAAAMKRRKKVHVINFFSRNQIIPLLQSDNRDDAIRELCRLAISENDILAEAELIKAVLSREQAMSTAFEDGIAVPHARLSGIEHPMVFFGRSLKGIDWDSPDGKPSKLVFLVITPVESSGLQLQTLSLLARTMRVQANRQAILEAENRDAVWECLKSVLSH